MVLKVAETTPVDSRGVKNIITFAANVTKAPPTAKSISEPATSATVVIYQENNYTSSNYIMEPGIRNFRFPYFIARMPAIGPSATKTKA
jgi:hypothetical protein